MNWIRTHKLLLTIYTALVILGWLEWRLPEESAGTLERPDAYLDEKHNVADVSAEVYPDRALTLYYQAYQAALCSQPAYAGSRACTSREPVAPGEVRKLIERALATGNRSIEIAMYNYAVVLIQENAPEEEIEAAIRNWRRSYPMSQLADPRDVARATK